MKCSLATILVLGCLAAGPALGWDYSPGPDYWPLDWANMYLYADGGGRGIEVVILPWGTAGFRQDSICMSEAGWEWTKHDMFQVDAFGDVLLSSVSYEDRSGVLYSWEYSPPLKFIDDPLFVGKTWTNSGTAVGATTESFQHRCVVERAETVVTPAGNFDTLVLVETDLQNTHHEGTYYLAWGYGAVMLPGGYRLYGTREAIGVESTSWGAVKSLFR